MNGDGFDAYAMNWQEGLPHPDWSRVEAGLALPCEDGDSSEARRAAWTAACRQWLDALGSALEDGHTSYESTHYLLLAAADDDAGPRLLRFAEQCRAKLSSALDGVADFEVLGKQVVLDFRTRDDYYRYISRFYPEGSHGASGGVHLREGYPHVALYGKDLWMTENTLAHESTHAALHHLDMPQWLEEGLAQMFEHDMTGRQLLIVDRETAAKHKRYWSKHGLDAFWSGEGFSRPGKIQDLSYQLAEIMVRLLVEESRPQWFGWVREPQRRFVAFLRSAKADDAGEGACREHLGCGVSDLAAKFLGPPSTD
ncbi:MAG: hypothetical protein ACRC1K_11245 [Planctomycetia bacterium]